MEGPLRMLAKEVRLTGSVTRYHTKSLIVAVSGLIFIFAQCHQEGHWASGESLLLNIKLRHFSSVRQQSMPE